MADILNAVCEVLSSEELTVRRQGVSTLHANRTAKGRAGRWESSYWKSAKATQVGSLWVLAKPPKSSCTMGSTSVLQQMHLAAQRHERLKRIDCKRFRKCLPDCKTPSLLAWP